MKYSEGINTCGRKSGRWNGCVDSFGSVHHQKRSLKQIWCYYLTALEERTTCL